MFRQIFKNGFSPSFYIKIGITGLIVGFLVVYIFNYVTEHDQENLACNISSKTQNTLKKNATGKLETFLVANDPLNLSNLTFLDKYNNIVNFSIFEGKTILLNLWATWCAPCRHEMPALDKLQQQLGDDSFEVVALSVDQTGSSKPKEFLEEINAANLKLWLDPDWTAYRVLQQIGRVPGLPSTLLIDQYGCEMGVLYGPAEWDSEDAINFIRATKSIQ